MKQRGGFAMGLVAGLLVGLALALGVALYITKAPVPFVNKVPQRTAEQDSAEAERNRNWDPNAALGGKGSPRALGAASAAAAAAASATPVPAVAAVPPPGPASAAARPAAPSRDPAAILSGGAVPGDRSTAQAPEPFVYFVQAGAYTRNEDAEQQRAKLAMAGLQAKITEREQAGRVVYRVRLGPFPVRNAADDLQQRLQADGIEAQIVRVEKQP
jgi:cell division protein FtsN